MAHELPPLPYDYSALEPVIDTQTNEIASRYASWDYVKNLMPRWKNIESSVKSAEELLRRLNAVLEDIRTTVRTMVAAMLITPCSGKS